MRLSTMKIHFASMVLLMFVLAGQSPAQDRGKYVPGATEETPSRAHYFSWINNTNEGATERHTLTNLSFFKWLHDDYGMQLDIYAFDAGAIDGANFYGSMDSPRFKRQFPAGFDPICKYASSMGTRLGLWGGPDGFGDSPQEEKARIDMMVSLCRDYRFMLFKMDAVCGQLRPSKYDAFDRMMSQCREHCPDLILNSHRLELGKGTVHATTYLLGGSETYIDVWMSNTTTAPHHRAGALSRELPPHLTRLTEDHGVCLSSCLDYWEDDLVLQAFNRNLVLSPQIYGNPWLLRDNEFPKLARIFNLHRKYNDILVHGMMLPEKYGPLAVSRGSDDTRLITLRNLTWEPVTYKVVLGEEIGLKAKGTVQVTQYHPFENQMGSFDYGSTLDCEVLPFRACLLKATSRSGDEELGVSGCRYEVVRDVPGKPLVVKLLGYPGEQCEIKLTGKVAPRTSARIDRNQASELLGGKTVKIQFGGEKLIGPYHRKIGDMATCPVPGDAAALYEATCFAADSNALEVRSLKRSGTTSIPVVKAAREAFFNQSIFVERALWDRNLFDGDLTTGLAICRRWGDDQRPKGGALRLDLGECIHLDKLVIHSPDEFSLQPFRSEEGAEAMVSPDLLHWKTIRFVTGKRMEFDLSKADAVRYVMVKPAFTRITEVAGLDKDGRLVDRTQLAGVQSAGSLHRRAQSLEHFVYARPDSQGQLSVYCRGRGPRHGRRLCRTESGWQIRRMSRSKRLLSEQHLGIPGGSGRSELHVLCPTHARDEREDD